MSSGMESLVSALPLQLLRRPLPRPPIFIHRFLPKSIGKLGQYSIGANSLALKVPSQQRVGHVQEKVFGCALACHTSLSWGGVKCTPLHNA
jgi:hypothetical protein